MRHSSTYSLLHGVQPFSDEYWEIKMRDDRSILYIERAAVAREDMNWFFFYFSSNRWDCRTWHYLILLMSGELCRLSCHLVCRQLIITTRNHVYFIFCFSRYFKRRSVLLRETETMGFFIYQSWWARESRAHAHSTRKKFIFLSFYWFWRMASSICWQSQLNSRCHGSAKGTSRGAGVLWVRPCVVLLLSHSSQAPKTQNFLPIGSAHLVWYCPDSIYLPTVVMSSLFERIKSAIPSDGLQIASYKVIRNVQVYHLGLYFEKEEKLEFLHLTSKSIIHPLIFC